MTMYHLFRACLTKSSGRLLESNCSCLRKIYTKYKGLCSKFMKGGI